MVFCKSCKYISNQNVKAYYRKDRPQCLHPDNGEESGIVEKTWFQEVVGTKYKAGPHKINKGNDCKLWEKAPPPPLPPEPDPEPPEEPI